MTGGCKLEECGAPGIGCHLGKDDYKLCENFISKTTEKKSKKDKTIDIKKTGIGWSGEAFTVEESIIVSSRSSPILIGIIGKADAGKTSFLGMLFTLLLGGKKLKKYDFAGTKTILGWDQLYHKLKFRKGNVAFPAPTPVTANRLYHLGLRNEEQKLKDILFADASGEVFSLWAINRSDENAENARWIYSLSDAFILFLDCEALVESKNAAKIEVMMIAKQMAHDLKNRPIIAVWSKSDKKDQILTHIKDTLSRDLNALFPNYTEIEISNFLEPGPDELVHTNNLAVVDWLLEKITDRAMPDLSLNEIISDDIFINYKGNS